MPLELISIRMMKPAKAEAEARKLYFSLSRSSTTGGKAIRLAELEKVWEVLLDFNPYHAPKSLDREDPRVCLSNLKYDMLKYWLRLDVEILVCQAGQGRGSLYQLVRALDIVEYSYHDLEEFLSMPMEEINELRNKLLVDEIEKQLLVCADDPYWIMSRSEIENHLSDMDIWHDFWPEDRPDHVAYIVERLVEQAGEISRYDLDKLSVST